jgi:hypothetical protein
LLSCVLIGGVGFPHYNSETFQADPFLFERKVFRYFELNAGP